MMYKIHELVDMRMTEDNHMFYDIELRASSPILDSINRKVESLEFKSSLESYTITKHLKEIKFFLKHLMKKLKVHNRPTQHEYCNQQFEGNRQVLVTLFNRETTKFLMEMGKDDTAIAKANLNDMKNGLIHAIQILNGLNLEVLWMDEATIHFFEVSFYNFQKRGTWQNVLKQGFIEKQSGGRTSKNHCCRTSCITPMRYHRKWFILTNQFLCYVERPFPKSIYEQGIIQNNILNVSQINAQSIVNEDGSLNTTKVDKKQVYNNSISQITENDQLQLREVMLIDHLWELTVKHRINKSKIKIKTSSRYLSIKLFEKDVYSWRYKLLQAIDQSPWSHKKERFVADSFAPLRRGNKVRIMIDGEMHFRNIAECIRKAESEIFITDWWLTAKLYLERPVRLTDPVDNSTSRLDLLLLAAAERGVKIYIMHWRESKLAVEFNSLITKQYLMGLHPNIKMLRHSSGAIALWSHHAKLVIIDQQIAFIGGLDICFGRWDTRNHPLYDIGLNEGDQCLWPGKDYCNERNKPIKNPEEIIECTLIRDKEARMPFHDTAVMIEGDTANDLAHHFVQLWNHAKLNNHGAQLQNYQVITTQQKQKQILSHRERRESMFTKIMSSLKKNKQSAPGQSISQFPSIYDIRGLRGDGIAKIDQNSVYIEEDEKFDENFDEIIQKNMNFNQFNLMQEKIKSPVTLQQINKKYLNKIQNVFAVLKLKRNRKMTQENGIITPRTNKVSNINLDGIQLEVHKTEIKQDTSIYDNGLNRQLQLDLSKPDSKNVMMSQGIGRSQYEEEDYVCFQQRDTTRLENGNCGLNDSGIIIKRENISIENPIFFNNKQLDESKIELRQAIEMVCESDDANNFKQILEVDEAIIVQNQQKSRIEIESRSPFINSEEVQILMHTPKKFDSQYKSFPHIGDEFPASPDIEKELTYAKRNLIQTFHSYGNIIDDEVDKIQHKNVTIQALRSSSPWSLGLLKVEHSIYEAYIQLIESAEHFIYIENQFFITQCVLHEANKTSIVKNKIGLALRERILRAHKTKNPFLVLIFVPLMHAFPGDIMESSSSILRLQMNYQMQTMARGKASLIELLKSDGIEDPWHYIRFFSLRNHSIMPKTGLPMTELIYIHSKCMIVDDKHVILGSANINDRSMLGSRDHEVAVVISQNEPEDQIEICLGGKQVRVSKLAHHFRTELMMEHFGFTYDIVSDLLTNRQRLFDQVQTNSKVYFEIFRCEPDNSISSFAELSTIRTMRSIEQNDRVAYLDKYERLRNQIFGHAVVYPVEFLKDENLGINFLNSEILVPEIVFV